LSSTAVQVATRPAYRVEIGRGILGTLSDAAGAAGTAIVVDGAVAKLHAERLGVLADAPRLALEGGENAKTLQSLGRVLEFLARSGLSRQGTVFTFGGGSISDVGGLAASLYKRGVAVVHCPTTLLAQVDAAVGGKTAINLEAGKNLAGTFHQPRRVLADVDLLATLPDSEWRSGLGEVVKTALVGGPDQLALIERCAGALREREPQAAADVVHACVAVKAAVVAADPAERGPRRALNLGHTFAHAFERTAGYGAIPHGVAVAAGIGLALEAAVRLGTCDAGLRARVLALLRELGLPDGIAALRAETGLELAADAIVDSMAHDKKGAVGAPELVLLREAGSVVPGVRVEDGLLLDLLD
jgi:3-dehydroquinate synthase